MSISIVSTVEDRSQSEKDADEKITAFDKWFQARGNDPLVRGEKAIIKTFLYFAMFEDK